MPLRNHCFSLARDTSGADGAKTDYGKCRMTNLNYSTINTVAQLPRLAKLNGGLDHNAQFKTPLVATLIEPVFSDG